MTRANGIRQTLAVTSTAREPDDFRFSWIEKETARFHLFAHVVNTCQRLRRERSNQIRVAITIKQRIVSVEMSRQLMSRDDVLQIGGVQSKKRWAKN